MRFARLTLILLSLSITPFLSAEIHTEVYKGADILPHVQSITDLSLVIYKEYPYLYEGTKEEYYPLIEHYTKSPQGLAVLLYDDDKPVGVSIGMPLNTMRENYQAAFLSFLTKNDLSRIFYLGEFLLLKEYRGQGLGREMYLKTEDLVKAEGCYEKIAFCKIVEFDEHPQMPENYKPLDGFWKKFNFLKLPALTFPVYWQNINETDDSPHQLIYWWKSI